MRRMRTFAFVLGAGLLTGLAMPASAAELRVGFMPTCPVTTAKSVESLGLESLLLGVLSDVGTRVAGTAIDKLAGKLSDNREYTRQATGRLPGIYAQSKSAGGKTMQKKISADAGCLLIAIGNPAPTENEASGAAHLLTVDKVDMTEASKQIGQELGIAGKADFYMEATLAPSPDGTAFALLPRYVYYPRYLGKASWYHNDGRDLLVRVELSRPGSDPFASADIAWSALEKPDEGPVLVAQGNQLAAKGSAWMKLPAIDAPAVDGVYGPLNVKVLLTETAKPNTLARYIGESLKSKKDDIQKAVKDQFADEPGQADRIAAKLALNDAAGKAMQEYDAAYAAARTAVAAWDATKKPDARNAAELAIRKYLLRERLAEQALKAAGVSFEPYPALTLQP